MPRVPGSLVSATSDGAEAASPAADSGSRGGDEGLLKVLFITSWYPTAERPVEGVFVREHALAAARHHDVRVLHLRSPLPGVHGLWELEEETDATLTEGIPTARLRHRRVPVPKLTAAVHPWAVLRAYRRIVAGGFRPDVLHAHVFDAGAAAALAGRLHGVPVVVTEHFTGFNRRTLTRSQRAQAAFAFRSAAYVLPVSRQLRTAIEAYGLRGRFRVVPNAVDLTLFRPGDVERSGAPRRLLFVGAFDESHKKGFPVLLEALARLRATRDDWHLDVVGDGEVRGGYERAAAELGLAERVTFHGRRPKPAVAEMMRRADLFVLPSLWENLPCVIAEAMASGLPVVATETGGVPEMVSERTGTLVPAGDAPALAAGLGRTLDRLADFDAAAIRELARERYGMESVAEELAALYDAVAAGRKAPGLRAS